jgi:hypothetical protein
MIGSTREDMWSGGVFLVETADGRGKAMTLLEGWFKPAGGQ